MMFEDLEDFEKAFPKYCQQIRRDEDRKLIDWLDEKDIIQCGCCDVDCKGMDCMDAIIRERMKGG